MCSQLDWKWVQCEMYVQICYTHCSVYMLHLFILYYTYTHTHTHTHVNAVALYGGESLTQWRYAVWTFSRFHSYTKSSAAIFKVCMCIRWSVWISRTHTRTHIPNLASGSQALHSCGVHKIGENPVCACACVYVCVRGRLFSSIAK